MDNKKATKKNIVKKKVETGLKLSKGKSAKSTKDKPTQGKTVTKAMAKDKISSVEAPSIKSNDVKAIVSSSLNPLNKPQKRSNSHSSKRPKKRLLVKDKLERYQVVKCLENIVAGIKSGTLCIEQGKEFVTLKPQNTVDVEIEAIVKKEKEKFVLELVWSTEREEKGAELHILPSCTN